MSAISQHVGQRIKKCRKGRGFTIEQFSKIINKSKATLSKYENGKITIDIDTLLDIADALEMEFVNLIDYRSPNIKPEALPANSYFNKHTYYLYYFDGRTKKIVRALIHLTPSREDASDIHVIMYHGLETFDAPDKCQYIFTGSMKPYDTITHMYLTNQTNMTERMYLCILNPMDAGSPAIGMLSGLGSNPFFAPISIKTLISKVLLEENEDFMNVLKLSKEDYHMVKYYNMMVINRPNSFFLEGKK